MIRWSLVSGLGFPMTRRLFSLQSTKVVTAPTGLLALCRQSYDRSGPLDVPEGALSPPRSGFGACRNSVLDPVAWYFWNSEPIVFFVHHSAAMKLAANINSWNDRCRFANSAPLKKEKIVLKACGFWIRSKGQYASSSVKR